jgi:hypothetical protein
MSAGDLVPEINFGNIAYVSNIATLFVAGCRHFLNLIFFKNYCEGRDLHLPAYTLESLFMTQ